MVFIFFAAQSKQTIHLSEVHQQDPYRQNHNNNGQIQTQYSGRSGAWNRDEHSQVNQSRLSSGPQGNGPIQNWNSNRKPEQYQNWNTNRQPVHNQNWNRNRQPERNQNWNGNRQPERNQNWARHPGNAAQNQNLDNGRQQQPVNQNWGPANRNLYNQHQQNQNYNPQQSLVGPHISRGLGIGNAMNVGIVPYIDPDLPDGLDDLWEMKQKQKAIQHMIQTNPGLIANTMMPGQNQRGIQGPQYNRPTGRKEVGGPGHVRVWTKATSRNNQNNSRSGWQQEYAKNIPFRSNFETEQIKKENINKQNQNMPLRPSSFADVSNKLVENKMTIKDRQDLLGQTEMPPTNFRQISQSHPLNQPLPATETKTTHLKNEQVDTGNAGLSTENSRRRYRKRGQNRNFATTMAPNYIQRSTSHPSDAWNVNHKQSRLDYEKNMHHRYRSRTQYRTTTPPYHIEQKQYDNRYQQRYLENLPPHIKHMQQEKMAEDYNQQHLPAHVEQEQQYGKQTQSQRNISSYQWDKRPENTRLSSAWDPRQKPHLSEYAEYDTSNINQSQHTYRRTQKESGIDRQHKQNPARRENHGNDNQNYWQGNNLQRSRTNVQYQKPEINNQQYGNHFYSPRNLESDRQSANSQYRPGTNQRLSNSNRNMERERERERENENGQTSFSMQISTKYGSGNKRLTKTMLQELITERLRQRQTAQSKNSTMPWDSVQEGGTRTQRTQNINLNAERSFYPPQNNQRSYQTGTEQNKWISRSTDHGFRNSLNNRPVLKETKDIGILHRPRLSNSQDLNKNWTQESSKINKTDIPAITGREVWRDPANKKEIDASRLSPTVLDEIIDSFLYGGGDEIETPYGKIEQEENGGYEIDGPLLRMILSQISTRQETKQHQSPKQLEHVRKFAGFDQSSKITPAPEREKTANNSSIKTEKTISDTQSTHDKAVDKKRHRIIWDSLPIFENPTTQRPKWVTVPESSSKTGRQVWNNRKPWDTVTTRPMNGQNNNRQGPNIKTGSPWEPVMPETQFNPLFESKILSNRKNASQSVKETNMESAQFKTVAIVKKQMTTQTTPKTSASTIANILSLSKPSSTSWTHVLFDEPFNLNKTPPVAARMIIVPEEGQIWNDTKAENDIKTKTVKPTESNDSAFGIILALFAGTAVLVAPILCIAWKIRKHYREKNRKQMKENNDNDDKFAMEAMIAQNFGKCDDNEKDQGARRKTYFSNIRLEENLHELQPLKSGRTSPNVIVHQVNEIF